MSSSSQAAESAEEWHGALAAEGRPITVRGPVSQEVVASRAAVRQILQVLLDNALRHGRGEVTVTVREAHDAVAVDVTDRGSSAPARWQHGLGLGLARSLAENNGGRLLVASDELGHARVTLLLPVPAAPVSPGPAAPA
jgi:signal transduction histidine kinase